MKAHLLIAGLSLFPAAAIAQPPNRNVENIRKAAEAARVNPEDSGWRGGVQQYSFQDGAIYQVYTQVGRVTDIALQPGEGLSDTGAVAAGDTARWIVGEASSGEGSSRRTHILVKPSEPHLVTNLVINTTKRSYHVELRSGSTGYMAAVAWRYPEDELIALEAKRQAERQVQQTRVQTGIDPLKLNYGYRISGSNPPWRPVLIFDDHSRTYILFPETIATSELPPLFLVGEKGEAELVNYRTSGRYMIVDRLIDRAELRLGTRRQLVVRIERKPASEERR